MKAIRIIAFVAGTITAAWIGGRAFFVVMQLVATRDVRGNYWMDSIAATAAIAAYLVVFVLMLLLLTRTLYGRRPVDRVLVVFGGYLGACLGAAFTLTAILWAVAAVDGRRTMPPPTIVLPATLYAGGVIGVFTLLPALAFIAVAEWIKVRAPVFYALAGVAAAILGSVIYLAFLSPSASIIGAVLSGLLLFGLPGLVGGLVYWGIAGRSTGQPAAIHLDGK